MTQMNTDKEGKDTETYSIIGSAMEVHGQLGQGFLESVYQEALALEFAERGVPFQREVDLPVHYKGKILTCSFRADFVCFGTVIVELKALGELTTRESSQVINYLKATQFSRAIVVNFGTTKLEFKRFILSPHLRSSASSVDRFPSSSASEFVVSEEVSGG